MLYDIDIIFNDGHCEYLLGDYKDTNDCLKDLQGYREYQDIDTLIIKPKIHEV
ncbi:MAG: hypothetical protein ACFFDY_01085 [Candidatus Thorarchaeota archaeon]